MMSKPAETGSQGHTVEKYRRAFLLTLVAFIAVAGVAAWLWWRSPFNPMTRRGQPAVASETSQPTTEPTASADGSTAPQADTPLAPIQLSPQRMQSIGVKVGTVESKVISDEIRSYGNVQANERRFAYVQTRFAGWIRQIYADATGDFIEKGQPLFTIYSPDLVASEREYLLAKKSAAALQQSAVSGVADGAASLIAASKARLQQFDIPESDIAKLDEHRRTDYRSDCQFSGFWLHHGEKRTAKHVRPAGHQAVHDCRSFRNLGIRPSLSERCREDQTGRSSRGHGGRLPRTGIQRESGLPVAAIGHGHTDAASSARFPKPRTETAARHVCKREPEAALGAAADRARLGRLPFRDQEPDFYLRRGWKH